MAQAVAGECEVDLVGIRPGEKIHEEMITETDSLNTYDCGQYYVITPGSGNWSEEKWAAHFKAKKVEAGFKYNSGTNDQWLAVDEIRSLVKKHVCAEL